MMGPTCLTCQVICRAEICFRRYTRTWHSSFGNYLVFDVSQVLNLSPNHIAGLKQSSARGPHSRWRSGGEDVTRFKRHHSREIFDLVVDVVDHVSSGHAL